MWADQKSNILQETQTLRKIWAKSKFSTATVFSIPSIVYKQYEHTSYYSTTSTLTGNMDTNLLGRRALLLNLPFLFWFGFLGCQEYEQPQSSLNGARMGAQVRGVFQQNSWYRNSHKKLRTGHIKASSVCFLELEARSLRWPQQDAPGPHGRLYY